MDVSANSKYLKSSNMLINSLQIVYRDLTINPFNYGLLMGVISPQIQNHHIQE